MGRPAREVSSPVQYRIVVRGAISRRLTDSIDGVRRSDQETVLLAEVADQAQLHGILERLRDFGIDLMRIEPIESVGSNRRSDA